MAPSRPPMPAAQTPPLLHWTARGSPQRPCLIFLHGFMGSSQDWRKIIDVLSHEYYCLAVDLPGHGQSLGLEAEQYGMAATATAIITDLQKRLTPKSQLGQNPPRLLIGYSMGGRLALYLALRFPQCFPQAQIISASPGLIDSKQRKARRELDLRRCQEIQKDFNNFLTIWYKQPLFESLWKTSFPQELMAQRLRNNPDELCRSLMHLGLGRQPNLWQELRNYDRSLYAITGDQDPKFVAIGREMQRHCPMLDLRILPGIGHNLPLEDPQRMIAEISRILAIAKAHI